MTKKKPRREAGVKVVVSVVKKGLRKTLPDRLSSRRGTNTASLG
jgi:hypothetical protein